MQAQNLQQYNQLLQAYYFGLQNGIVTKQEVASWADSIIQKESKPDYFFIELSLCYDVNNMLGIISNAIHIDLNAISARALIGFISHKYEAGIFDNETVISMINKVNNEYRLTMYEYAAIFEFDDIIEFYPDDHDLLTESIIEFFNNYKSFTPENYREWEVINHNIEVFASEKETKYFAEQQEYVVQKQQAEKHRQKIIKRKTIIYNTLAILFLIGLMAATAKPGVFLVVMVFIFLAIFVLNYKKEKP